MQAGVVSIQKSCRLGGAPDCEVAVCFVCFVGPSQIYFPLAQIQLLHVWTDLAEKVAVFTRPNVRQKGQLNTSWEIVWINGTASPNASGVYRKNACLYLTAACWLPKSQLDVLSIPLGVYATLLSLLKDPSQALKGSLPPEMEHGSDDLLPSNCSDVQVVDLIYACGKTRQTTSVGVSLGHAY